MLDLTWKPGVGGSVWWKKQGPWGYRCSSMTQRGELQGLQVLLACEVDRASEDQAQLHGLWVPDLEIGVSYPRILKYSKWEMAQVRSAV